MEKQIRGTNMQKISYKTKFSYMCGDLGCCLMIYMVINYFMFYSTNMLGIPVAIIGTIIFISRIWWTIVKPVDTIS